jgi:Zn-dependent M16 (insulinase) family peptidase
LQALIRSYLLDNPHRTTVTLKPDQGLAQQIDQAEKSRLASARAQMSRQELQAVIDSTLELRRLQETPDTPEALATLPMLTLEDLDRESKSIPIEELEDQGAKILFHDLFTNGIVYLNVGFNLHTLPQEYLPLAGLFGPALLSMGTETEDFVKLSQRIGRKTGGISPGTFLSAHQHDEEGVAWLFLNGKATMEQTQDLLDILSDVLLTANLDNRERFRQIVLRNKAGHEAGLIPGGHRVVNGRLSAHFSKAGWASEQMSGLDNLFYLRQLQQRIEEDWPSVLVQLEAIREHLINGRNMLLNVTTDAEDWSQFQAQLSAFIGGLPQKPVSYPGWSPEPLPRNEGLTIPAQVNYVGKGANLYDLGYEVHGSISVITNYLRTTWLWEKVRVQGGAYGGFCLFRKQSGLFSYLSYRDPNLSGTLKNYDGTADFLRHIKLNPGELTKSVIGAIGALDAYQLPDAKGYTSMQRYLLGVTDEERQQYRDEVLSSSEADFRAFAEVLKKVNESGQVVVLGSSEAINGANGADPWLDVAQVM